MFDGHVIGDVSDRDHRCSVDIERAELRPAFRSKAYEYRYVGGDPGLTLTTDNILCYNFTKNSTPVLAQEKASTTIAVNELDLPILFSQ